VNKTQKLWALFITAFSISAVANSGFAILAMMKDSFVKKYGWFTEEEMDDYVALVQGAPGPMGVNASVIIGYQVAGVGGVLCAVLGCILPALLVMLLVTHFYDAVTSHAAARVFMRGMQMGVVAMLFDVIIDLLSGILGRHQPHLLILVVLSFLYVRYTKLSVLYLALTCAAAGLARVLLAPKEVSK